jgi:hypothetical protein
MRIYSFNDDGRSDNTNRRIVLELWLDSFSCELAQSPPVFVGDIQSNNDACCRLKGNKGANNEFVVTDEI